MRGTICRVQVIFYFRKVSYLDIENLIKNCKIRAILIANMELKKTFHI